MIIELPPGDYLTSYVIALEAQGNRVSEAQVANLAAYYGARPGRFTPAT